MPGRSADPEPATYPCTKCGYDRTGLAWTTPCPECAEPAYVGAWCATCQAPAPFDLAGTCTQCAQPLDTHGARRVLRHVSPKQQEFLAPERHAKRAPRDELSAIIVGLFAAVAGLVMRLTTATADFITITFIAFGSSIASLGIYGLITRRRDDSRFEDLRRAGDVKCAQLPVLKAVHVPVIGPEVIFTRHRRRRILLLLCPDIVVAITPKAMNEWVLPHSPSSDDIEPAPVPSRVGIIHTDKQEPRALTLHGIARTPTVSAGRQFNSARDLAWLVADDWDFLFPEDARRLFPDAIPPDMYRGATRPVHIAELIAGRAPTDSANAARLKRAAGTSHADEQQARSVS